MNTLIIIFIIWTIIKALSKRAKDRPSLPLPPQRDEDTPTYRLPPDLKEKWGVKTPSPKTKEQKQEGIILAAEQKSPKIEQNNNKGIESKQMPQVIRPVERAEAAACNDKHRECVDFLPNGQFTPNMLRNGVILAEILGPPVARRRSNRSAIN